MVEIVAFALSVLTLFFLFLVIKNRKVVFDLNS